jgi:hypothetical protein
METWVKNLRSTEHLIGPKQDMKLHYDRTICSTSQRFPSTLVEVCNDETFRVGYLNVNKA